MKTAGKGKLLRIFIGEADQWYGEPREKDRYAHNMAGQACDECGQFLVALDSAGISFRILARQPTNGR